MGHGLYEQGLPADHFGLPLGESVSLGIHESQSRLWENHIGRTAAFGRWLLPQLEQRFGDRFDRIDAEEYHRRMCAVVPGYIRVDADEATYDLHIFLRFELERAMVRGELAVADLPEAWNARFAELFGFAVDQDANGCLQDVHWSAAYGYFPTYTLGNCYAAQLMATIRGDLPDLEKQVAAGDFTALLGWLREHIHRHGRRFTPRQLCARATGSDLDAGHLLAHIEARYG
jgi:carboxypeptidase Taq